MAPHSPRTMVQKASAAGLFGVRASEAGRLIFFADHANNGLCKAGAAASLLSPHRLRRLAAEANAAAPAYEESSRAPGSVSSPVGTGVARTCCGVGWLIVVERRYRRKLA